jgi:hypothetical protein
MIAACFAIYVEYYQARHERFEGGKRARGTDADHMHAALV